MIKKELRSQKRPTNWKIWSSQKAHETLIQLWRRDTVFFYGMLQSEGD